MDISICSLSKLAWAVGVKYIMTGNERFGTELFSHYIMGFFVLNRHQWFVWALNSRRSGNRHNWRWLVKHVKVLLLVAYVLLTKTC